MMKTLFLTAALTLSSVALAGDRVVILGDEHLSGVNREFGTELRNMGYEVFDLSAPNSTLSTVADSGLPSFVNWANPDYVVLMLGTNDWIAGEDYFTYVSNYVDVVKIIDAPVVCIAQPDNYIDEMVTFGPHNADMNAFPYRYLKFTAAYLGYVGLCDYVDTTNLYFDITDGNWYTYGNKLVLGTWYQVSLAELVADKFK